MRRGCSPRSPRDGSAAAGARDVVDFGLTSKHGFGTPPGSVGDEAQELVRDLVRDRSRPSQGRYRSAVPSTKLRPEAVRTLEVAALLNAGVLVDDATLLGGKVGRAQGQVVAIFA